MTAPGDLPTRVTSFVGRHTTVVTVAQRLANDRLVTLCGPGGCGKTRLALEIARQVVADRDREAFFVDLSGLSDPRLVPSAVLGALELREVAGEDPVVTIAGRLADRELLLLLDNCEHLVAACGVLVTALLANCPAVRVLATSREPLAVPGEALVAVGGLSLPERLQAGSAGWLERSEAGKLFIERARLARADFCVDDAGAPAIARICERLDGIPLAMELAAARTRLMSVSAIAHGLSDRFRLLVGTGRGEPRRQQSMLASIEWSCGLLKEDERAFLHRLSVFASGFTLAGAGAICCDDSVEQKQALRLLTSLVDKSLVQVQPEADRFRLHETMRAYVGAALEAEGRTALVRDRHLDYFTQFATQMLAMYWTNEVSVATRAIKPEIDNLRAALDWSIESKEFDAGARLVWASAQFFSNLGLWAESLRRCERLLKGELDPKRRAEVLFYAAIFSCASDPESSLRFASELTKLGRASGDERALAFGLSAIAAGQSVTEPQLAIAAADEGIPIARRAARFLVMQTLCCKSDAYRAIGRVGDAISVAEQAVEVAGEPHATLYARATLSLADVHAGRLGEALDHAGDVLALGIELSEPLFVMLGEIVRGQVHMYRGEPSAAEAFDHAHAAAEALGDGGTLGMVEFFQGDLKWRQGHLSAAYDLLEGASAKGESMGQYWAGNCRALLAELALRMEDLQAARRHLTAASGQGPNGARAWEGVLLATGARFARIEGQPRRSHGLACEGLGAAFRDGALLLTIELLELVALTNSDLGHNADAARLLGAADVERERTGYVRSVPALDEIASVLVCLKTAVGPEEFADLRSEGRRLQFVKAIAYACRGRGRHVRAASGWESLTPTERRVVVLVAEHLDNAEIARQLFVSTATVKSHLTRVFAKLSVSGRRELAKAAAQHGWDRLGPAAPPPEQSAASSSHAAAIERPPDGSHR
jgi:predicted ATPase/DNA-binding CsgD family transcriptional regulator